VSVKIIAKNFSTGAGYDLQVLETGASLRDYLEALNNFILEGQLTRSRGTQSQCAGCDLCCHERIPLTLVDIYQLKRGLAELGQDLALADIIKRYTNVKAEGSVIDITLGQTELGECLFLETENKKCTIYNHRPLVCQTYICAPLSQRAERLRETIVNLGEDQLVKWCLQNIPEAELYHEAWEPEVNPADWIDTPFQGKEDYDEVLIKEICPPRLWQALLR